MGNGEWRMENKECRNGRRKIKKLKMENGEWRVKIEKYRMENGKWRMENGE